MPEPELPDPAALLDQLVLAERRVASLERSLALERGAAARVRTLNDELVDLEKRLDFVFDLKNEPIVRPKWAAPRKRETAYRGTVTLMLSDLHLDEVVNPDEIEGVNAYDRAIAEMRLQKVLDHLDKMTEMSLDGLNIDGCELILGGDLVTGALHDLAETNEDTVIGTCVYWIGPLAEVVWRLRERFGNVVVRNFVGNHGRNTRKPRTKLRVRDNFDWLLAKMLEREFAGIDEVQFDIPESADVRHELYNTKFLGTHGDQFRGGNGIAGIFSAVMHGQKKKLLRTSGMPEIDSFDVLYHGHFHQHYCGMGLIGNGSTKGYDEYAYVNNFSYEPPSQTMWVTTPEHGVSWVIPLFCQDRKQEGW